MSGLAVSGFGRLTKDPESKPVGQKQTNKTIVRVAVNRGFGDNKQTDFYNVAIWGKQGENVQNYCKQGTQVYFRGVMETRESESQNGGKTTWYEVNSDDFDWVFNETSDQGQRQGNQTRQNPNQNQNQQYQNQQFQNQQYANQNQQFQNQQYQNQNPPAYGGQPQQDPYANGVGISDDDLPF